MASKDQIANIITAFHTTFPKSGFIVLNSDCQLETTGELLLNYKGLKIAKFDQSEMKEGDFDPLKFNNICHARCQGANPAKEMKQLYEQLREEFPLLQVGVIAGQNYQASGELTTYKKGDLSVYLF